MSNPKTSNATARTEDPLPASFFSSTPNNKPQQEHSCDAGAKYGAEKEMASKTDDK
jgi:hypothetical protein